jgi:hypothetical protein
MRTRLSAEVSLVQETTWSGLVADDSLDGDDAMRAEAEDDCF